MIVEEALLHDFKYGTAPSSLWEEDMTWYGSVGLGMATNKQVWHFLTFSLFLPHISSCPKTTD